MWQISIYSVQIQYIQYLIFLIIINNREVFVRMSKLNLKNNINLNLDKNQFQSRLTQSTTFKTLSRGNSVTNSNPISSSSSMANISINFNKDSNFPKLFANSPMLFSFNAQPMTSKNSSLRSSQKFLSGFSSGARTPSASSLSSIHQIFDRQNSIKKHNFFSKKSNELVIDISKKQVPQRTKPRSSVTSIRKQHKATVSSTTAGDYQSCLSSSYDTPKLQNIKVFIRIKPSETRDIFTKPYIMRTDQKHLQIDGKIMVYDHIFAMDSLQQEIFQKVAKPVLSGLYQGYNGTIFAYGQTGSGKTYTIFGGETLHSQGLISRSIQYIFSNIKKDNKISLSLLQIYKQELIDLLKQEKSQLKIKQTHTGGVSVQGLSRIQLQNVDKTIFIIQNSLKNRKVASTRLNQKSSRSHTILTIHIQGMQTESKLCLIDLAGSQKANKAGVIGQNFQEMKKINYSLSCLGNVINALVTRKKSDHIPFRDSKLTRLLKDSLSGRFRTSIIVNCSSDFGTQQETMSSLKFADRAKKVKITISKTNGKGKQNVQYLHKIIQQLTNDLQSTKRQLNKYKQICIQKPQQIIEKRQQTQQMTTRQTIPSQRAHLQQQMKKYGKQNKRINVISAHNKQKTYKQNLNSNPSINLSQISSLNVSKSTMNFFGQINSPSVSSLSYRPDQCMDDFSFHFNSIPRSQIQQN